MDSFFDGEFFSYGTRVLGYSDVPQEQRLVFLWDDARRHEYKRYIFKLFY